MKKGNVFDDPSALAALEEIRRLDDIRINNWDPTPGDLFSERLEHGRHVEAEWGVAHRRNEHISRLMVRFGQRYGIHPGRWADTKLAVDILRQLGWTVAPPEDEG